MLFLGMTLLEGIVIIQHNQKGIQWKANIELEDCV